MAPSSLVLNSSIYAATTTTNKSNIITQFPHSLSLSSSLIDLGLNTKSTIKLKKKPNRKILESVECGPHPPSVLDFPKQPYNNSPETVTNKTKKVVNWNPIQKAAAIALNIFESALLSRELQNPLPKTSDPKIQIAGNFAPVPEQPVVHFLPVTGTIPDCINGVYVRNGPNPMFEPLSGHHLFDGDGMVHAVTINDGTASYACRFIETERLIQERELGRPVFPKPIGEIHGYSGIARLLLFFTRSIFGIVDHRRGAGVANTGLVYFNGKLLAMSEDDLPYELQITPSGDVKTVARYSFDDQLHSNMIAHPRIDPVSGELFALSYEVFSPYLKFFRFTPEGKKSPNVKIRLPVPTMTHDFAITENFIVIPDQQIVFKLEEMFKGGLPVIFDRTKKSRFGILPKYTKDASSIVWIESQDTFCFHLWNAWEEQKTDEIVVICSCMTPPDSIFNESNENLKSVLTEIRLNLKTVKSTRRELVPNLNLESGTVNKNRVGRKTRFVYLGIAEPWPKVSGFAKVDLESGEVKKYMYGDGRYGGEPFFVAKGGCEKEDEGYVMALVHDERRCESELQIVNAVEMKVEATVMLPCRVPYGFHGTFVEAKDLTLQ